MMTKRFAIVALGICSAVGTQTPLMAQMGGQPGGMGAGAPPAIAPGTPVDPAKSFDAALSNVEKLWMGLANAMPAEKYSFAPTSAIFAPGQKVQYDGVRSFLGIVTHTTQANYGLFAGTGGMKPDMEVMKSIAAITTKDEAVKAMADSFAFAHKAVASLTTANAFESTRGLQTRASAVAAGIGHAEDEYGQAVEYVRMNGMIPPASETPAKKM